MSTVIELYAKDVESVATCNTLAIANNARIRNSPSLKGEILGVTDKYVEVQVRERSSEPEIIDGESWYWYKVHGETFSGWMYGKYLDKIDLYL